MASIWNELILEEDTIQDTNDRFLANIQKGGTYSVIPRILPKKAKAQPNDRMRKRRRRRKLLVKRQNRS
jgi:hypothetical protein